MMTRYKCFLFEEEESSGMYYVYVYYNGTQAHVVKSLTEDGALRKAQQWVDDEGYEWLE
jgi:hypothetical protein